MSKIGEGLIVWIYSKFYQQIYLRLYKLLKTIKTFWRETKEERKETAEEGFNWQRSSRSLIRRQLSPSSLNPLGPMDPPMNQTIKEFSFYHRPLPSVSASQGGMKRPKKTLILDLDETLVHANITGSLKFDYITEVRGLYS